MPYAKIFNNGATITPFDEDGFTPIHLQQLLNDRWLEGSEVRRIIEVSVPRQCIAARCGPPPIDGETDPPNRCCYICGFPITHTGGSHAAASQCEHVLTVLVIAMICGLSHPDYQDIVNGWMDAAAGGEPTETIRDFYQYREKLLRVGTGEAAACGGGNYGTFYKWAHPSCNLIKNNFPYLPIKFDINGPEVDLAWVNGTDEFKKKSIKYTLYKLISYTEQNSIKWVDYWGGNGNQSQARQDRYITTLHPCTPAELLPPPNGALDQWKLWADGRSRVVLNDYIQPIAGILNDPEYTPKKKKDIVLLQ